MANLPNGSHATLLWLLPAAAERQLLREVITRLARECDAPVFEPHLTLGRGTRAQLEKIRSKPLRLRVLEVDQSAQYTKTLFVRLQETATLRALRHSFTCDPEATYDPHISLLYRSLSELRRIDLTRSIALPFATISFDEVVLIRATDPTTGPCRCRILGDDRETKLRLISHLLVGNFLPLAGSYFPDSPNFEPPGPNQAVFPSVACIFFMPGDLALDSGERMNNNQPDSVRVTIFNLVK